MTHPKPVKHKRIDQRQVLNGIYHLGSRELMEPLAREFGDDSSVFGRLGRGREKSVGHAGILRVAGWWNVSWRTYSKSRTILIHHAKKAQNYLTGGNNVINAALELAAMLSGDVARLYYVQAEDEAAEKCVRFTAEDGYWVELPVMPMAISRVSEAVLQLLSQKSAAAKDLYSRLLQHEDYWNLIQGIAFETFQDLYLRPMWKQGLITKANDGYVVGPQWALVRPYQGVLEQARRAKMTIEAMAQQEPWLTREDLPMD